MAQRKSQAGFAEALMHPSVGRNRRIEEFSQQLDWEPLERSSPSLNRSITHPMAKPFP